MRQSITGVALAVALLAGWTMSAVAQQSGLVIQNNGVDSTNSAAGADNVNISYNAGNAGTASGGGVNNEIGTAARDRDRKERNSRKSAEAAPAEELVAPAEEFVAPAEGDYQAYSDAGEYVEPVPAPEPIVADASAQQVLQLPSTGVGDATSLPLAAAAAGIAGLALGFTSYRRRQTT